ncbi:MAG: NAD-dependent dihydropyrimidine dehydrogenase subunit PreA, partial [Proteobacteria bacterium]|nr:NAD-dependent dihydropyrimidine dehydrogenase subunit PreA [Pseudomonadota bacterium]
MAELCNEFLGIRSPNPFWLASAPPTDKAYNVNRAFEAGWGGAVWKTLGEAGPPIVNVSGPRYAALHSNERRVIGFNNIELITDRPLETNLDEIRQVKKDWPDRALVVSVMLPMNEESWAKYLPMIEDTGCDAFELNFGCPHGMSERGMGSAVGQVPEYIRMATEWAKAAASIPVIVKLTPNVTNIVPPAKAALDGGADAVSLINTINSIMRVDYDSLSMYPTTDGMGTHGGYCGEAVKPIALNMVAEIARNADTNELPISGIGGVTDWRDGVDFLALGASTVQVCTAAMVYGFRIIDDLVDGLGRFLDDKDLTLDQLIGRAVPSVT